MKPNQITTDEQQVGKVQEKTLFARDIKNNK